MKLKNVLEAIGKITTWKQVVIVAIIGVAGILVADITSVWRIVELKVKDRQQEHSLYRNLQVSTINKFVQNYDKYSNSASGIGIITKDEDLFITYLNKDRSATWKYLDLEEKDIVSIYNKKILELVITERRCHVYFDNKETINFQKVEYHVTACSLLNNKMLFFSFHEATDYLTAELEVQLLEENVLPLTEILIKKIENAWIRNNN